MTCPGSKLLTSDMDCTVYHSSDPGTMIQNMSRMAQQKLASVVNEIVDLGRLEASMGFNFSCIFMHVQCIFKQVDALHVPHEAGPYMNSSALPSSVLSIPFRGVMFDVSLYGTWTWIPDAPQSPPNEAERLRRSSNASIGLPAPSGSSNAWMVSRARPCGSSDAPGRR